MGQLKCEDCEGCEDFEIGNFLYLYPRQSAQTNPLTALTVLTSLTEGLLKEKGK
jgi:hypothetical protein